MPEIKLAICWFYFLKKKLKKGTLNEILPKSSAQINKQCRENERNVAVTN